MTRAWGRLYAGTRNHRKIKILRTKFPNFWAYFYPLLEVAFECNDGGHIRHSETVPFGLSELAKDLDLRQDALLRLMVEMCDLGIVSLVLEIRPPQNRHEQRRTISTKSLLKILKEDSVVAIKCQEVVRKLSRCWQDVGKMLASSSQHVGIFLQFLSFNERQFVSDISTERVRKYRESKAGSVPSDDGPGNGDETPHETDQNRTEQNRVLPPIFPQPNSPPPPPSAGTPPPGEESFLKGKKKPKPKKKDDPYSSEFSAFWSVYPNKKGGKDEAWQRWERKRKAGKLPPLDYLLKAVEQLKESPEWLKDDGAFIPMVTTWLNKGRWTDVDGLKSNATATKGRPDPDCPYCKGEGMELKDEKEKRWGPCRCRKRAD